MATRIQSFPLHLRVIPTIRAEMGRRGVLQKDVAQLLKLSQAGISDRLNGITPLSLDEIQMLADYFGIPVLRIFEEAETAIVPSALLPRLDLNQQPSGCRVIRGFAAHAYSTTPIAARWRTTCTTTVTTRWTGLRGPRSMRGEGGMP